MLVTSSLRILATVISVAVAQYCEHQWDGEFAEHDVDGVPYLRARQNVEPPPLDIQPLIVNGPSENRIDLIFFGDGYTEEEKDKFFDDAMSLATEMTSGQTFADHLPLMNYWAGFSASKESGVGTNGQPLDTVYGLYRPGTELRGVYYDKPQVARAACQSTDKCDYPMLLGNDPFYGGLGGTFTVVTASPHNGAAVLRHELGHSIIGVGEEYDGGQVYRGVNSARTTSSVPWTQWYTDPSSEPKIQRSNMPIQAYPWTMLNVSSAWSAQFISAGVYDNMQLQFSISGVLASSDLRVELDGKDLGWEVNEVVGMDRWIYNMSFDEALTPGTHTLTFALQNEEREGTAQLCNLEVLEYGPEDEFTHAEDFHGLFPTYSATNQTTYRPTNDKCLMRTMHSVDFCDACIEGLWYSLLGPLSLIDNVTQVPDPSPGKHTEVTLQLLPLAELREIERPTKESYEILWYAADGATVIEKFTNSTTARLPKCLESFEVEVRFHTEQVRSDPDKILMTREKFDIQKR